jgi:hypothetical protein
MELDYTFTLDDCAVWAGFYAGQSPYMRQSMSNQRVNVGAALIVGGGLLSIWRSSIW